jgi:transcriptional regulator with XRE-family HTH domain
MTAAVPEPMRQFVSNLTRLIAERGVTPAELAARADIHRSHLTLILAGERRVQLDTLVKLAGALEVPPEQLLEGVEWISDGQGGGEFRSRRPDAPG